jgi:hypothetical protein
MAKTEYHSDQTEGVRSACWLIRRTARGSYGTCAIRHAVGAPGALSSGGSEKSVVRMSTADSREPPGVSRHPDPKLLRQELVHHLDVWGKFAKQGAPVRLSSRAFDIRSREGSCVWKHRCRADGRLRNALIIPE